VFDIFRRDGDSSNTVIGIILLVMLLVFVGPGVLPSLLSRTFPFVEEGVPCTSLQRANNRAAHQSLIGRQARNPLTLRTALEPIPANDNDPWIVRIIINNNTIGTIPFVFAENQVIVGDNGTSGVGIIVQTPDNQPFTLNTDNTRQTQNVTSFPEDQIRVLGPRQRCIFRLELSAAEARNLPNGTTIRSYYRITTAGVVQQNNPQATPIFNDQGLAILDNNLILSEPETVPIMIGAN